ncbi:UbiA-like protein EboC [Aurantibacter crassamenti]|uniref:UbiA-like protein EboC n=1 Tax=Aurantibacter crassamenti TaxID=1837375 RepID=UPI00193A9F20|nr:UbiA-like protein EboC [Aurantibacter crassamenti]MBM1107853.1 UbiA-like protein EboC [Aurantibacter crassamenti]
MSSVLKGYLQLMRPANLPTAAADIFAGVAIGGLLVNFEIASFSSQSLFLLVFASVFLYAGGVVLNDVFDYELDAVERPERPIPSGLIPLKKATVFGTILLLIGVFLAFLVNELSGYISIALALAIVLYDAASKKHGFFGPFNMGLCRSLNLLLGMSVLGELTNVWFAIIPLVYIFAITLISRGEVHGDNKKHIIWASILYVLVIIGVISIVLYKTDQIMHVIPFLGLFAFLVFKPLMNAYRLNSPNNIKKAVIAGVLSLIVLDAALAVGFSYWWYGLLILLLLPLSMLLSKIFAVT